MAATVHAKRTVARAALDVVASEDIPSLNTYFRVYNALVDRHLLHSSFRSDQQAAVTQNELLSIVSFLKNNAQCTKDDLRRNVFLSASKDLSRRYVQNHAINEAVQLICMVDCDAVTGYSTYFALDNWSPRSWLEQQTFSEFISQVFPHSTRQSHFSSDTLGTRHLLTAWYLVKRLHITLYPTDSLANHLLLDTTNQAQPVLYVFHHTTFLKAQLRLSEGSPIGLSLPESLEKGFLPRQLIIETLTTLQHILFHAADDRSDSLLEALAVQYGPAFDHDCLKRDKYSTAFDPAKIQYVYLGERLAKLRDAVKDPRPTSKMMVWVHEHTSERNALYVAILGLFLAVFFGLLGLIINIVQVVISYRAWKYPVSQPSE